MKVLAALSGGVDSAVAAARAVEAGHDVTAVHMALSSSSQESRCGSRGCCTIEDKSDAARAAAMLGIPFYVWDLADTFEKTVVDDFLAEYRAGRTPNPCVRCNEFVKFRELLERGLMLGFDAVATGHYAKMIDGVNGPELHRGECYDKDQSYVLAVMGRDALDHVLFPLGDAMTKADVRAEAERRGLPMSEKPDSYDICFIADGDTSGFLRSRLGSEEGHIVDVEGKVLGTHQGAYAFTVGQRKGLRIERPAADGRPRYVLGTDMATNTVIVGAQELLSVNHIECDNAVLLVENDHPGLAGKEVTIQYRAHGQEVPAQVTYREGGFDVSLLRDTRAVASGQSLVVYDGTHVLGQATITRAYRQ
ncbi:MAG: tRNA 2-thiouridine(34) synthase MnmA [Actinomycetaceae bacterium]|nr:tRNA 2-thiouridine(34) synthase MnmA [Actinomycetaceae bacterium]